MKPEMILVCNAILNNLKHPNEYVRGSTLRFLCKITELEILEPLVRLNLPCCYSCRSVLFVIICIIVTPMSVVTL